LLTGSIPTHTQTACKRFILCHRDRFGWHLVTQAGALLLTVGHDRFFNATGDLLLRPIRSPHKPIEARELQEQTHEANPAGPNFSTHQMYPQNQSMEEGETRDAVKKRDDSRTLVQALLVVVTQIFVCRRLGVHHPCR